MLAAKNSDLMIADGLEEAVESSRAGLLIDMVEAPVTHTVDDITAVNLFDTVKLARALGPAAEYVKLLVYDSHGVLTALLIHQGSLVPPVLTDIIPMEAVLWLTTRHH